MPFQGESLRGCCQLCRNFSRHEYLPLYDSLRLSQGFVPAPAPAPGPDPDPEPLVPTSAPSKALEACVCAGNCNPAIDKLYLWCEVSGGGCSYEDEWASKGNGWCLFGGDGNPPTEAPSKAPTKAPTTTASTKAPTTRVPTTKAPTTKAPTTKASTTKAPTTKAPTTKALTTQAPTTTSSAAPTPPNTNILGEWVQCTGKDSGECAPVWGAAAAVILLLLGCGWICLCRGGKRTALGKERDKLGLNGIVGESEFDNPLHNKL